jgi:hypothetical protein
LSQSLFLFSDSSAVCRNDGFQDISES